MTEAKSTVLRDEKFTIDGILLSRETWLAEDGQLFHELSITHPDSTCKSLGKYNFQTDATNLDSHLSLFDEHWGIFKKEFKQIIEEADLYFKIKQNNNKVEHQISDLKHLPLAMLGNPFENVEEDEFHISKLPLMNLSERLEAFRYNAVEMGLKLDPFEESIRALKSRFRTAEGFFEDAEIERGFSESDYDNDDDEDENEDWRGDEHEEDEEDDDISNEQMEEIANFFASAHPDEKLAHLLTTYETHLDYFTDAANLTWLNATNQIYHNQPVTKDERSLEMMQSALEDSIVAYDKFRTTLQEEGLAGDYTACTEYLEDEEKGTVAKMQKMIATASSPKRLEAIIGQSIVKQRQEERRFG